MKPLITLSILLLLMILILFSAPVLTEVHINETLTKFSSKEEFSSYISSSPSSYSGFETFGGMRTGLGMGAGDMSVTASVSKSDNAGLESAADNTQSADRYSETNAQVEGVDEADIVKTDGTNIYFSSYPSIKIFKAYPAEELNLSYKISNYGDLFIKTNDMLVLGWNSVENYDKESGASNWKYEFNGSLVDSRMYGDYLYLVIQESINVYTPCPINVMEGVVVNCAEIYRPIRPISADSTYHIVTLNAETGELRDVKSFVGSYGYTTVYMSTQGIYVTYDIQKDMTSEEYVSIFADILPNDVLTNINKILGYEISSYSKRYEIELILQNYYNSLSEDEALRVSTEIYNKIVQYRQDHKRELIKTGIVKVSFLDGFLTVSAVAEIPGRLLNQFSLDEYNDYLRAAVTVGSEETENDVYILNKDLLVAGQITGLGITERIYSARFVGDKGYLVTFKQTDPFYVLDLSDPANPSVKGELKIPGYSSYLHPIDENTMLGIGKEDAYVKISVFDVSNVSNPVETSKYSLEEYWSELLYNHKAFLMDKEKKVFFLPGGNGGYIFSYNGGISLLKTISGYSVRRAVYINDVMYVIADANITAINENTWETIKDIAIESDYPILYEGTVVEGSTGAEGPRN